MTRVLSAHYRQPLEWSDGLIEQGVRTLDRLYGTLRDLADVPGDADTIPDAVEAALCDDLNTPAALTLAKTRHADLVRFFEALANENELRDWPSA